MSASAELQKLILDTLTADTEVMAEVNGIYDRVPEKPWGTANQYISFGPSDVVEDDAECIVGGEHTFQIDCWSRRVGMVHCRRLVDRVKAALHEKDLELAENALVQIRVTFRRILGDPDPLTTHGVVTVQALIEETD
ncbi:DUF3168 domain-containing protein [Chelativorans sp. ZYF759]|uniref:DUF3168 domain-containing protein n=1 Tax=Chelativorans sp. ZYF759 TaxID=2692213 RepID=UPI00145E791B|nr:DUF3168 domain-containing protein [Chelativorans sp. ZYF759]NMG39887.1 DUF3168 domain-containing protein [Chelativorans sp. ZYF759]